jgi:hypothetical protein
VLPPDAGKARRTWCRAGWVDRVFLWVLRVLLGWGACGAGLGVCWGFLWVLGLFLLKCPTSLRFFSPEHFISYGVPFSLKASFEGE